MIRPRQILRLLLLTLVAREAWSAQARERRVYSAGFDASYAANQKSQGVDVDPSKYKDCQEPSIANGRTRCVISGCRVTCQPWYKTTAGQGSARLHCDHTTGHYTLKGQPWNQSPLCLPYCGREGCQHGGKCVGPKRCQCARGYQGEHCQQRNTSFCPLPDLQVNDAEVSSTDTHLKVKCNPGFAFPIGGTVATVPCRDGAWSLPPPGVLLCLRDCNPPCQNGGTCVEDGLCKCPQGYWGPVCHVQRCNFPTRGLNHTSLSGTLNRMKIECHEGHEMRSGKHLEVIKCVEGAWIVPQTGLLQDVDTNCYPVCVPACLEGGQCTAPGQCSYPGDDKGGTCKGP